MHIYPYVYRLDHPITGEFYIGYRSANKVPAAEDLGFKYFTSSKVVKPRFHEFDFKIIAEFFDFKDALFFENNLIMSEWGNNKLLNKHFGGIKFSTTGTKKSMCARLAVSNANKGRGFSEDHKRKISTSLLNHQVSDTTRQKMSASAKKKIFTDDHKQNIRSGRLGKKHSKHSKAKMKVTKSLYWQNIPKEERRKPPLTEETKQRITTSKRNSHKIMVCRVRDKKVMILSSFCRYENSSEKSL